MIELYQFFEGQDLRDLLGLVRMAKEVEQLIWPMRVVLFLLSSIVSFVIACKYKTTKDQVQQAKLLVAGQYSLYAGGVMGVGLYFILGFQLTKCMARGRLFGGLFSLWAFVMVYQWDRFTTWMYPAETVTSSLCLTVGKYLLSWIYE